MTLENIQLVQWRPSKKRQHNMDDGNQLYQVVHNTVKPVFKGHLKIPEQIPTQDRCPFITGSLTWGRQDTVLREISLMSLKYRVYCIIIWPLEPTYNNQVTQYVHLSLADIFLLSPGYLCLWRSLCKVRWHLSHTWLALSSLYLKIYHNRHNCESSYFRLTIIVYKGHDTLFYTHCQ